MAFLAGPGSSAVVGQVRRAGQHPPDLRRILRWVVTEFGAGADPGEVSAEQLAAWLTAQWAERAPSTWDVASTPSARPPPTGGVRAGSAPTRARLLQRRKPRPDRSRALSRAEVERLLTREDASLRERTLWRMLYETAARSAEVLGLDVENPHRQRPTRHGPPAQPGHHRLAADREIQYRRRLALPRATARPAAPDDLELLVPQPSAFALSSGRPDWPCGDPCAG